MSSKEIDDYLAALDEPKRSTLQELRRTIMEIVPEADEIISYGMPPFECRTKSWLASPRSNNTSATSPTADRYCQN